MNINRKKLLDMLAIIYPFLGQGKSNTATNILSYYKAEDSFWGVTNGSLCAFISTPSYFSRDFKVDGNLFFQTLRGIKSEEVDIFFYSDTTLRLKAYDENDNTTDEVDFRILTNVTMTDYCKDNPSTNLDAIPIPETFTEALQTCLPYINTNEGKLSYVYFYGYKAISANNNASSEIAVYTSNTDLLKLPRMFISGKDGTLISKTKVKWTGINYIGDYYRLTGKIKDNNVSVVLNALNEKENYPVIIDAERYDEKELNEHAGYTLEALERQSKAEQIKFNKKELNSLLSSVTVNGIEPNYNMLSMKGNEISYVVRYPTIKKSKIIKTNESYPEVNIKLNPSTLKNILDIDAEYISIDRNKIVAKNDKLTYICFIGD